MSHLTNIQQSSSGWDTFGSNFLGATSSSLLQTSERVQNLTDLSQIPSSMSSSSSSDPFPGGRVISPLPVSFFEQAEHINFFEQRGQPESFTTPDCFDFLTSPSVDFSTSNSADFPLDSLSAPTPIPFSNEPQGSFGTYFPLIPSTTTAGQAICIDRLSRIEQGPLAPPPPLSQQVKPSSSSSSSSSMQQKNLSKPVKRKTPQKSSADIKKEKQRLAAIKSRRKKQECGEELEARVQSLTSQNELLKKQIELLSNPSSNASLAERFIQVEAENKNLSIKVRALEQTVASQDKTIASQGATIASQCEKISRQRGTIMSLSNQLIFKGASNGV